MPAASFWNLKLSITHLLVYLLRSGVYQFKWFKINKGEIDWGFCWLVAERLIFSFEGGYRYVTGSSVSCLLFNIKLSTLIINSDVAAILCVE
jgi:hypothetical protein